jgi:DNA-binding transcriptional ArsR family regulator
MIRIRLGLTDVGRIRFGFSPLSETVLSLRTLSATDALHAPWVRQVLPLLGGIDLDLLTTLVPRTGYIPDFLLPPVPSRAARFDTRLAHVAGADPELVAAQLRHLATHPVAFPGADSDARRALLRGLAADPEAALTRVTTELRRYWQVAVEPYWPRIRALLRADLSYRLDELAGGGVQQLFRTLHPLVALRGDELHVTKYWDGTVGLGERGLLLVPCVFAWPDVIVRTADPQPALTYSPRGLGRLWSEQTKLTDALAGLIGRSRAAVLAQLDLPMTTTQLACLLDLTPPTLSVHLRTLAASGVVTARRDGRSVLYQRTRLGEELLRGTD